MNVMRRLRVERADERGLTLVELLVTMFVMLIIVAAVMSLMFRAFNDTAIATTRANVQNDGRIAMERMSKQIRQATSVTTATPSDIVVNSYFNGVAQTIEWSVNSGNLQMRVGTSGSYLTMARGLVSSSIFTYQSSGGVVYRVDIAFSLSTKTVAIPLTTSVYLRNM